MEMKKIILFLAITLASTAAMAGYDANIMGELDSVAVYTAEDSIYVVLKNQPTSHAVCNPAYFVIPPTVPADRRKALLARLSLAFALKESVNIGYDSTGGCANGYIYVWRVG